MKLTSICMAAVGLISVNAVSISTLPLPAEFFEVNGRTAFLMRPEKSATGNPWVWYAPTLNAYPTDFQKFYFEQLLENGIAVAGYDLGEVRGAPESSKQFAGFYNVLVEKGYAVRPVLLGQSRGGLMLLCWAFRNPDKVGAFAGIYPVCNIASWPLLCSKPSVLEDYGMPEDEIMEKLETFNPTENMAGLAKYRVPVFLLHGDADQVVPYGENGALIKKAYEKAGGEIEVKIVPGKGHVGGPEFFEDRSLLDFILKHCCLK